MKIQYANMFFKKLGMGDPTTYLFQVVYDENDSDNTKIIQYLIIHGMGLDIKVDSYVAHIFYAWSFSNTTAA